ncbi:MAG: hypothetical protein NC432_15195 [Roseburia sp.]|nr:hypothetical protein [Roseburia sp.]MCM1099620.1 hypothetical protein [Ruminococcus flavefaciens]
MEWLIALFTGGRGMGAHFFPIMIQFVFFFRCFIFIVKGFANNKPKTDNIKKG